MTDEEYLTVQQVAAILNVHPATVYVWIRTRGLPAFKPGGNGSTRRRWRVRRSDLERWMQSNAGDSR